MSRFGEMIRKAPSKLRERFLLRGIYQRVFETEEGKAVLEDLLSHFGWAERSTCVFNGVADPARASAYFEGQRSVWIHIQSRLHMSETDMRDLQREAQHREAS